MHSAQASGDRIDLNSIAGKTTKVDGARTEVPEGDVPGEPSALARIIHEGLCGVEFGVRNVL
jgi:hypothetical protein